MKENNESYKYIKFSIWALVFITFIQIILSFSSESEMIVNVKPTANNKFYDSLLAKYSDVTIGYTGLFKVNKPTIWQKLFLPPSNLDANFLRNFLLIIIGILIIKILPNTKEDLLFEKDISGTLKLIGLILFMYSLLKYYVQNISDNFILEHTNQEFQLAITHSSINLEIIFGAAIIWAGVSFKKAYQLKQDQKLTI